MYSDEEETLEEESIMKEIECIARNEKKTQAFTEPQK